MRQPPAGAVPRYARPVHTVFVALLSLSIAACSSGDSTGSPNTPDGGNTSVSISVTPASGEIGVGETLQLSASVSGSSNNGANWSSSNASVATVTGLVTGVGGGTATITATAAASSSARATASIVVTADPCAERSEIQVGQSSSGSLTGTDCIVSDSYYTDFWTLTVGSEASVIIDLSSSTFDTFMFLYDSGGSILASDDDGGTGTNSRIAIALSAGTYVIEASSFSAFETGSYTLQVSETDPCEISRDIVLGQTVTGALSSTDCTSGGPYIDFWDFTIGSTSDIVIDLTSEAFDTFLRLYDAGGAEIANDDDGGEGFNSQLAGTIQPGDYTIGATSFATGATGFYDLRLSLSDACSTAREIKFRETLRGQLETSDCVVDGSFRDRFFFTLDENDTVSIRLASSGFIPTFSIQTSGGEGIGGDDNVNNRDYATVVVSLNAGTYFIDVSSVNTGGTGVYDLSLRN